MTEKDASVIFSVLETKGKYLKIIGFYVIFYLLLPLLVTVLWILMSAPFLFICICSATISVFQIVAYAELYKVLFQIKVMPGKL